LTERDAVGLLQWLDLFQDELVERLVWNVVAHWKAALNFRIQTDRNVNAYLDTLPDS
jgi:hypothetical protein